MAAGLGFKEFTTGDVLTAADANGYLASQVVMVFASAAARASAITSPQEGMITYLKDTNSTEYYSGSAYVAIGGASASGLTLITTGTYSASSAVSLNSIFTSTYTNYKVIFTGTGSGPSGMRLRMRASSTDNTASNYLFALIGINMSGSAQNDSCGSALLTSFLIGYNNTFTQQHFVLDILNPQTTINTTYTGSNYYQASSTTGIILSTQGGLSVTTSYDGMTVFPDSGTISGSYWVYGYQKA